MLQLKPVISEQINQNFCLKKNDYVRKQKDSFQELAMMKLKTKQLFSKFMELNSEKARRKFIQDLRNKKKTQAKIQSLLNSSGDKITKPMEIANLLNYRFSTLGEFICLQQTNNNPPKTATRKCFKFRYITSKETNVLIDSLNTSKPVGSSKIPAWAIKDLFLSLLLCQKIFEKMFISQITSFLEREQLLSASQFGYTKHISTIDAILKSTEQIRLELNKKKMLQGRF